MEDFQSEKLVDGVVRISCPGNVYAYLVEGSDGALLIDTGFGYGSLKEFVEQLTDLPYAVVLTHGHLDHAGGAGEFETVYLNREDLDLAKEHTAVFFRRNSLKMDGEYVDAKPAEEYLPLEDGQRFLLGGMTVTMLKLEGHTAGSMCALVEERRALLLGDAVNSLGYLQLPESLSLRTYAHALKYFVRYRDRFDTVWFSHPHNFGGKEILSQTITLCEEILSGKRKGVPYGVNKVGKAQYLAKEIDERERPKDGTCANFVFCKENISETC